jgi:hypothetical protein
MKKTAFFLILVFSFSVSAFQCKKNNNSYAGECIKGRLIDALCGNIIVQVIDGDYNPSLVVNNWHDPQSGNTYDKVFAVSNFCDISGIIKGQEFNFHFEAGTALNTCPVCAAIRPLPPKANMIKVTASCN